MTAPTHTFRDRLRQISVPWLATGNAQKFLYAMGVQIDAFADALVASVKLRFPNVYSGESLPLIGRERRIARGSLETDTTYAARLTRWLDDHPRRGGPYAMLAQLHAFYLPLAFTADLIYRSGRMYRLAADGTVTRSDIAFDPDPFPEMWARWWLIITSATLPPHPLTDQQISDAALVPTEWNAAHCFGLVVVLRPGSGELWDYPVTNTWDEGGTWDTADTIDYIPIP